MKVNIGKIVIVIIGAAYCVVTCRTIFIGRALAWRESAYNSFWDALREEAEKPRKVLFRTSFSYNKSFADTLLESGTITKEDRVKEYHTTARMREHSLYKSNSQASIMNAAISCKPIQMDTLNMLWDSLLQERHVRFRSTQLRYSGWCDRDVFRDSLAYSKGDTLILSTADSLTSIYIGAECQKEYAAYITFPSGIGMLRWSDLLWLLPLVILAMLYIYCNRLARLFYKEKEVVVEKEVIKEVPTMVVKPVKGMCYQLGKGLMYNSFTGNLTDGKQEVRLTPQRNILLKRFLQQENHTLTYDDIKKEFGWENNLNPNHNIHSIINGLKKDLKLFSTIQVISGTGEYRLYMLSDERLNG